jgi:hypothetical protein
VAVLALVLICYGAVTLRQASLAGGAPLPVIDALQRSARALPALFAATLIVMLAIVAGLALAVLPGLAAVVWLSFAWIGVLVDGRGPVAALGDSVRLVRGRFWPLAGLFCVALAVVFVYVLLMVVLIDVVMAVAGWRGPADAIGQGLSKVLVGIVVSLPIVYLGAMLVVAWRTVLASRSGADAATAS